MDLQTPAFGKSLIKDCNSFSKALGMGFESNLKLSDSPKVNKKYKKGGSIKLKNKSKFQQPDILGETHSHNSHHHHKKKHHHHHSQKLRRKAYDINNIIDFIKHHRFELRNDFDKNNVQKFLLAKEQAFKMPFEELISSNDKSYF